MKYGALLIPAYGTRTDIGGIEVCFDKPIKLENVNTITQKMNSSLEKRVEATPTQWYWPHRRWK